MNDDKYKDLVKKWTLLAKKNNENKEYIEFLKQILYLDPDELLPQNMPDDLFKCLSEEAEIFLGHKPATKSTMRFGLAAMKIKANNENKEITEHIDIIEDELVNYAMCFKIDSMRREVGVEISLPGLSEILIQDRKIKIKNPEQIKEIIKSNKKNK